METPTKGNLALVPRESKICPNPNCSYKDIPQPLTSFYKCERSSDGLRVYCKSCEIRYKKEHPEITKKARKKYDLSHPDANKKDRDKNANNRLRVMYKITLNQYNEILLSQNGGCAICGNTNLDGRRLAVDHDHRCCSSEKSCGKCIRGLLCYSCNQAIGQFKDSIGFLRKAIEYLERGKINDFAR